MSYVEEYIKEKITNNTDELIKYTLKKLSELWNVGQTSILRVANKMNFESFKDLQMHYYLKQKLNEMTSVEFETDIKSNHDSIDNVFKKSFYSILKTWDFVNEESLFKIKDLINSHKKIVFFGVGNSHNIAKMLSTSLSKIGYNSIIYSSTKEVLISIEYSNIEDNLFILYSNSGSTKEVVYIANKINSKNGKFILVTSDNSNYLNNALANAKEVFQYYVNDHEIYSFPQVSQQFCQIIFNNLILNLLIMDIENRIDVQKDIEKSLGNWNKPKS